MHMKLTSLMTRSARVSQRALVIALAGGCPLAALAGEGGITHILPGSAATLIDLLPTKPGWIAAGAYLNYSGDASADKLLPIAGSVVAGLATSASRGATLPLHRPPGAGQQADAIQRHRVGRAEAEGAWRDGART
jgi:hypothetical protein